MEPTAQAPETTKSTYLSITLEKIKPSRHQARKVFDEEALKGLAESMKEEGLIQPITVRLVEGGYELIGGERRLRAAKMLGWTEIDAKIVLPVSEGEAAAKGLIENLQREDLNPIEEAEGFNELGSLDPKYWTQEKIAKISGKTQSYISRSIALISLPEQVKNNMRARIISRSHGLELARLSAENQQIDALNVILEKKLSWEATRNLVGSMLASDLKTTKKTKKGMARSSSDPFASIWGDLKKDPSLRSEGVWDVSFNKGKWSFTVDSMPFRAPGVLGDWFQLFGKIIKKIAEGNVPPPPSPISQPPIQHIPPVVAKDGLDPILKSVLGELKHKDGLTPERLAHLLAIGEKGPGPIVKELLPEDPLTNVFGDKTWEEMSLPAGAQGLAQILLLIDQRKQNK